jgi:hypothetical protein
MERAVEALRELGVEVQGVVGVDRPMDAVMDALREDHFDEVVVSTLPHGVSHWLHIDLPARVARYSGLPVHHIVGQREERKAAV